jgi:hypothetical protein
MVLLLVKPAGLRFGASATDPQLTDIRKSYDLVRIAHCVILETSEGLFWRKGSECSQGELHAQVEFDGDQVKAVSRDLSPEDEARVALMQKALRPI